MDRPLTNGGPQEQTALAGALPYFRHAPALLFALNKPHVIDFVLRNGGFSSFRLQDFVCLRLKPCNFCSSHEAPSPP